MLQSVVKESYLIATMECPKLGLVGGNLEAIAQSLEEAWTRTIA